MSLSQISFICQMNTGFKPVDNFCVQNQDTKAKSNGLPLGEIPLQSLKANYLAFKGKSELEENMALAKEALEYVNEMDLISTTRWDERDKQISATKEIDYDYAIEKRMYLDRQRANLPVDDFIKFTVTKSPLLDVGNCTEQAVLAADCINRKGIKNFALIAAVAPASIEEFKKNPTEHGYNSKNHVFVVVGIDEDADLEDPSTWGKSAVVVDPWTNITGPPDTALGKINRIISGSDPLVFMNYTKFIDPSEGTDIKTPFNWENYRRDLLVNKYIEEGVDPRRNVLCHNNANLYLLLTLLDMSSNLNKNMNPV